MKDTMPFPNIEARIAAANRLRARMPGWVRTDAALTMLNERFPGFGPEAVLLKAVAVNALYGTYVIAIVRMTDHLAAVVASANLATAGPELVERIAALKPASPEGIARRHTSFAAKFAHFFIDGDRFPIYDERARVMLGVHLGTAMVSKPAQPYATFAENFAEFRRRAGWIGSARELDRYLWLAGSIRELRRNPKAEVNQEIRSVIESTEQDVRADVEILTQGAA